MENCLKTQLKAVVNNDNLPIFGAVIIKINEIPSGSSKSRTIVLKFTEDTKVKVKGSGYIQTSQALLDSDPKTELIIPANLPSYIQSTNIDMTLIVENKYNMSLIQFVNTGNGNTCSINIDELQNSEDLYYLEAIKSLCYGNIKSLKSTNITQLQVGDSQITGSIEDFVSVQYDAGRTSPNAPVFIGASLNVITFGSNTHNVIRAHLLWDSKEKINIHYGDNTFANCTTVLEKGYNATEIKVWTDAGKTVTDVVTGTVYPPTNQ